MPWWSYLLIVIAILLMLPYIRFLIKRISLCFKIKSFCKQENLIFHKTSVFWWLGVKKSGGCNFYIETSNAIYSIKLFPTLNKQSCVHFWNNRSYYVEKFMVLFGTWGSSAKFSFKSRIHSLGEFDFKYKFNDEWSEKPLVPILLVNPICRSIKLKINDNEQFVCDGDALFETRVFGLKGLISEISGELK